MAAVVAPVRLAPRGHLLAYPYRVVVWLRRDSGVDGIIRLASVGAIVSGVAFAVTTLGMYAAQPESEHVLLATTAAAVALSLHVHHLRHALADARPPGAGWTLAALAVVVIAPTPLVGAFWLQMFHLLAASTFLLLRARWGVLAYVALTATAVVWALALGQDAGDATWFTFVVTVRGLAQILLVWLVVALRRLELARRALADQAVEMERRRIDEACGQAVGVELEFLVRNGERASERATEDVALVAAEVRSLVDRSRRTLAEARRMLRRHTMPVRAELECAVTLLRVAGIDAVLELPDGKLPAALDQSQRLSLQQITARLLNEPPAGRSVIRLAGDSCGQVQLECVSGSADARSSVEAVA